MGKWSQRNVTVSDLTYDGATISIERRVYAHISDKNKTRTYKITRNSCTWRNLGKILDKACWSKDFPEIKVGDRLKWVDGMYKQASSAESVYSFWERNNDTRF